MAQTHSADEPGVWSVAGPIQYSGCCDASAGVALSSNLFVVANDEDNLLRVYRRDRPGGPVCAFDVTPFLGVEGKHTEGDFEACSRIGKHVFWIGSHGRSKKGKKRPARCRLFAASFTFKDGEVTWQPLGIPYENLLGDLMTASQLQDLHLKEASSKAPKEKGGMNIEGLCATPEGALLIGFRNPLVNGKAVVVPLLNPLEVIDGATARFGEALLLDFGGLGIRGMGRYGDVYLIIAGSYNGQGESRMYTWDGKRQIDPVTDIDVSGFNPEGIVVFRGNSENGVLLISDDGAVKRNGKACKDLKVDREKQFRAFYAEFYGISNP